MIKMDDMTLLSEFDRLFDENYKKKYTSRTSIVLGEKCEKIIRNIDRYPSCVSMQESDQRLIISLTTIPERIDSIDIPIKCMLLQTKQVNRIILWLDENSFNNKSLPKSLTVLQSLGLEIRYVKDAGPHTKYIYALKEFENDYIITIDDDIVYPRNLVEVLWQAHEMEPHSVCGAWIWNMRVSRDGVPYPSLDYKEANSNSDAYTSNTYIAQGVGGVLYPPQCIDRKYLDTEVVEKVCPRADDIYLKAIEIMSGTDVARVKSERLIYGLLPQAHKKALYKINQNGGNDVAIRSVFHYFSLFSHFVDTRKEENNKELILYKWVELYQNDIYIKDYLIARKFRTVAIYGLGRIGKMLLSEFESTKVHVSYGIDRRKEFLNLSIPVCTIEDELEPVELIIITASSDFDQISEGIKSKIDCCIVSLEDLLAELLWEYRKDNI